MKKMLFAAVVAVMVFASQAAWADTVTTYTTLASFQAAAGSPLLTEDFADAILQPGLTVSLGDQASISGGVLNAHGVCLICSPTFPNTILGFSPATSAAGGAFDLRPGGDGGGLLLKIAFANATTTTATVGPLFNGFFGVVSNGTGITSIEMGGVDLTGNGETFTLDNLEFRTAGTAPVPEPMSILLFGTVVLGLLGTRALRQKRS